MVIWMVDPVLGREEKEDRKTGGKHEGCLNSQNKSSDADVLESFNSLYADEARLIEQKEHLRALLGQLETRAKEEFEKRKRKVEKLNSEVADLMRKVEKFSIWINSESYLECSQADP
jgi:chromosome segregation ATPase